MSAIPISSLTDDELAELSLHRFRDSFLQKKFSELKQVREQVLLQVWFHRHRASIIHNEEFTNGVDVSPLPETLKRAATKNLRVLLPLLVVRIISLLEEITDRFLDNPWEEESLSEMRSLVRSSTERNANLFDYLLLGEELTLYSYVKNREEFYDTLEVLAEAREFRNTVLHPHSDEPATVTAEEVLNIWRAAMRFLLFTNAVASPAILNDLRNRLKT